jgi:hypothetical protein
LWSGASFLQDPSKHPKLPGEVRQWLDGTAEDELLDLAAQELIDEATRLT